MKFNETSSKFNEKFLFKRMKEKFTRVAIFIPRRFRLLVSISRIVFEICEKI